AEFCLHRAAGILREAALQHTHLIGLHQHGGDLLRQYAFFPQLQGAVDGVVSGPAAGIGLFVHFHDLVALTQAFHQSGHIIAVADSLVESAIRRVQNVLRSCHAAFDQQAGGNAVQSRSGGMEFFAGGALRQEGPQSAGLGTGNAEGVHRFLLRQSPQLCSGGRCSERTDDAGGMPAPLTVAGHVHSPSHPAHDLIACNHC
ncbi:bifunctional phosphoserine phosphatase/homoserine phosphotransferase ThrH, partial [Dysosmobacter welbionis]